MKHAVRPVLLLLAALSIPASAADAQRDPMRPLAPSLPAASPLARYPAAAASSAAGEPIVARHLLMIDGRRYVFDGKRKLEVGQLLGDARIVAIEDSAIVVRRGATTQRISLFSGVVKRPAAEPAAPDRLSPLAARAASGEQPTR